MTASQHHDSAQNLWMGDRPIHILVPIGPLRIRTRHDRLMLTAAASRSAIELGTVVARADLHEAGVSKHVVTANLAARRWQTAGLAIVLHNSRLTRGECQLVALINCGPRAVLTSFTAAEQWGLRGWERPEVHVLSPAGTTDPQLPGLRLHRRRCWESVARDEHRRLHQLAPALVVAASSFASPRPAIGLLAAAVQQRLGTAAALHEAVQATARTRHRAAMLVALDDIGQGADALSEIDFTRLCRRHGLPRPERQAIRVDSDGRRRYLDAEWRLPDGRSVAVEIDGALHMSAQRWYADQLRQNDIVLGGTLVLRFPSAVVRHEPELVVGQLRRALTATGRS